MSPQTSPLKARDVNTSLPSPTKSEKASNMTESEKQPMTMEYHRQVLQSRLEEDKYVPRPNRWTSTWLTESKEQTHLCLAFGHDHEPRDQETRDVEGKEVRKGQSLFANMTSKNTAANENRSSGSLDAEVNKAVEEK
ncbi:MAG: hypothetical protein Q9168_002944 [Polycauliona sp. 1 TL-2023]